MQKMGRKRKKRGKNIINEFEKKLRDIASMLYVGYFFLYLYITWHYYINFF